ncbi:bifunctional indole-3-glycerol-phosphate synthase TrpC/phosphoribosylanthranilate isomerase TrpF [Alteromonas sp. ASW11-36]|uniref:Multifunctional fusion protein n=1 Tax=Alteromonas arenosi TaxID=3055817 RepID=A0ABT7SUJ5_9ALTE|nr:bifunctional indole-3-glycerol-phosphate synthase TrpC/phosphoribosylanthranilate isomerase TrpF [Alteromonas sp. ASW11-36]MDM7859867.1 bifunctional indole-3-glycerol-phosphate synthase TrpC/phosphoribosylanthranilate isomerase TrpF [Alteromonas sp. ASW11-36]
MANVLEKIVIDKRSEIAARKQTFPLDAFISDLQPSKKSFFGALSGPDAAFILECKKASPSKGLIRENFDLDEIIAAYQPYAACISVLTDEKYFQGKFEYLEYVAKHVEQPVINKDFFVDEYQVHLGRYHGADAILLMLSVLTDDEYRALRNVASQYQMDVLTEVSNEEEMQRAIALEANIIGINNRNLRDLSTDLATTERLVPMLENVSFPHVVISESGIYSQADVRRLSHVSDGFLVGSALMAESDLAQAVKNLIYPQVKVCGITDVATAQFLADSPVRYAGLIFASQSKRAVEIERAKEIVAAAKLNYVGVFVDQSPELIVEYADALKLSAVQLHGNESTTMIRALREQLPSSCQIWKAIGIEADTQTIETLPQALRDSKDPLWSVVDKILVDCKVGAQSGGTGQQFDWQLVKDMVNHPRLVLAGGIGPDSAVHASQTGVALIDVNSGVEDAPGQKNEQQLSQLFAALRAY